jgi:hypothetical protein
LIALSASLRGDRMASKQFAADRFHTVFQKLEN